MSIPLVGFFRLRFVRHTTHTPGLALGSPSRVGIATPWLTFMLSFIFIVNYLINRLALIACNLLISLQFDNRLKLWA